MSNAPSPRPGTAMAPVPGGSAARLTARLQALSAELAPEHGHGQVVPPPLERLSDGSELPVMGDPLPVLQLPPLVDGHPGQLGGALDGQLEELAVMTDQEGQRRRRHAPD